MYHEHFGLHQAPFRITPQTEHFFSGAQRGPLLDALIWAICHDEGILLISGEVGTGKTMLCRMLIERMTHDTKVVYLANPSLNPRELIEALAEELEITNGPGSLLRRIEKRLIELFARNVRVVVVVDEAHAMPRESLDQIRLLSNLETPSRKLLQIVLFGQPELDELLAERSMRSLNERITQRFRLQPLDREQIREYLDFRLRSAGYRGPDLFGSKVLDLIACASRGLTRRVNILADKILLAAFAEDTHTVTDKHARLAIRDANYRLPSNWHPAWFRTLTGVALVALSGTGLYLFLQRTVPTPDASAPHENIQVRREEPIQPALPAPTKPATPHAEAAKPIPTPPGVKQPSLTTQTTAPTRYAPIPEQLGPLARERVLASRIAVAATDDQAWFLQLRSIPAAQAGSLEGFIVSAEKVLEPGLLRLFVVRDDPKQTVGVIYGVFAGSKEAYAALQTLPAWIKGAGAYPRQYKQLKDKPSVMAASANAPSR